MTFTETACKGAYIIDIKKIEDERGFFSRTFCGKTFSEHGLNTTVVQTNMSLSKSALTLRGLHMQVAPHYESKLVRCTKGSIFDVLVDMRTSSETYLKWVGEIISADNYRLMYVPEGFAHGYLTLEPNTEVTYHVSAYYAPDAERGYRYDDPAFNIEWPAAPVVISKKDLAHPFF